MTRGFITIATGKEHYYEIASNLLASYRHFSSSPMPFAILCDRENEHTALFDDVVILEHPLCSYVDKVALPDYAPYDENIFIDADSLAYRDLNDFWDFFEGAPDFTAFGRSYPLDFPHAWFKPQNVGSYGDTVEFIPDFIGGVYFIRKTEELRAFSHTCKDVMASYYQYTFRQFEDPCDEPIFALSMAAHGFRPVDDNLAPICFYPQTTSFEADISKGVVSYDNIYVPERGIQENPYMVHWGSGNTLAPVYLREVLRLYRAMGDAQEGEARKAFVISAAKDFSRKVLRKAHLLGAASAVKRAIAGKKG